VATAADRDSDLLRDTGGHLGQAIGFILYA